MNSSRFSTYFENQWDRRIFCNLISFFQLNFYSSGNIINDKNTSSERFSNNHRGAVNAVHERLSYVTASAATKLRDVVGNEWISNLTRLFRFRTLLKQPQIIFLPLANYQLAWNARDIMTSESVRFPGSRYFLRFNSLCLVDVMRMLREGLRSSRWLVRSASSSNIFPIWVIFISLEGQQWLVNFHRLVSVRGSSWWYM